MVKGLLVAAVLHGTYNSLTTLLPWVLPMTGIAVFGFIVFRDGVLAAVLIRKLRAYRRTVAATDDDERPEASGQPASADD